MKKDLPLLSITNSNWKHLDVEKIVKWDIGNELPVRANGEFDLRAFYLNRDYDWVIGYDSHGSKILVALYPPEEENTQDRLGEVR